MAAGHVIQGHAEPRTKMAPIERDTCAVAPVRGDVTTVRAAAQVKANRACRAQTPDDPSQGFNAPVRSSTLGSA